MSPNEKVQIVDASFKLCIQRLDEGLIVSNEKVLKKQPAIYPYLRSEFKTTSIPSGQYSFSADDIFQGLVPCQLIVGLVASAAYSGDTGEVLTTFEITIAVLWASTLMDNPIPLSL